jgi:hypothetical protein
MHFWLPMSWCVARTTVNFDDAAVCAAAGLEWGGGGREGA